ALEALDNLPQPGDLPFALSDIRCQVRSSRTVVHVPCDEPDDEIYGFGLDPRAYQQKGLKKWLTVCASVMDRTGASHGPVPFYVSTRGYGVYVDTARVPHVHVARLVPKATPIEKKPEDGAPATTESELYQAQRTSAAREVVFDLAGNSTGVDVYVFGGPTLREAVQRYNLFSGGGCVPPMWGLGMKYRTYTRADRATVESVAESIRKFGIPCDMLGLEPGWQTQAYSCSLVWSDQRFPNHKEFLDKLTSMGFKPNLWEHAYIHPTSPLHEPLLPHSGDYLVWGGLVVDFADPEAYNQFADYHEQNFFNEGVL
ncbi:MAG: hypothetical protein GY851_28595, partial [bacterium]|nr:hypothetical protein [bacterium]